MDDPLRKLHHDPLRQRPGTMTLLHATRYNLPPAGWASILHRASGALLFLLLPLSLWLFDASVTSEISYERFAAVFAAGIGWVPGWLVRLAVLALLWAFLAHFFAGLRHLWQDVTHAVSYQQGKVSAQAAIAASSVLTLLLGARLFGVY